MNSTGRVTCALDIGDHTEPRRSRMGSVGPARIREFREGLLERLAAGIGGADCHCPTPPVSSEHCQSRLLSPEEAARLRSMLLRFRDDAGVVLYLCARHEVALDAHGAIRKDGAVGVPVFPEPLALERGAAGDTVGAFHDHDAMATRWEGAFGAGKVAVRLFPKDLIGDFLAFLRLGVAGFVPFPWRRRASVCPSIRRE